MKKSLGTAVIIENKKGEFLLQLRDEKAPSMKNQWCLLGGLLEENFQETLVEAAVREIEEEIGQKVDPQKLRLFKIVPLRKNTHESYIYHTVVDLHADEIKVGEGQEFRFFSRGELLEMLPNLGYTNPFLEVLTEFLTDNRS